MMPARLLRGSLLAVSLSALAALSSGCEGIDLFGANNVEPSIGTTVSSEAEGKDLPTLLEMFTREATAPLFSYGVFRATLLDYSIEKARLQQRANHEWWDAGRTHDEIKKIDSETLVFEAYISGYSQYEGWGKYWKFVLVDSARHRRAPSVIEGQDTPPGWAQDKRVKVYYNYLTLKFPSYQVYETTHFIKLIGISPKRDRYELVWNFVR